MRERKDGKERKWGKERQKEKGNWVRDNMKKV